MRRFTILLSGLLLLPVASLMAGEINDAQIASIVRSMSMRAY